METIWRIDIVRFVRWVMPLPSGAFVTCVLLSLIFNFEQSTATHCRGAVNYLPSISAAIGGFVPQRYIWRICLALHCTPRFLLAVCYHRIYAAFSHEVILRRELYGTLVYVMTTAYLVENACLLLLSFVSSTEDYKWHEKGFIGFAIAAEAYMVSTILLCRWKQSLTGFSSLDARSLQIKTSLLCVNLICVVIGSYLFLRHNKYCESGVYTGFAACEYAVVASNIGFHSTCALYDLRQVTFAINSTVIFSHKDRSQLIPS